MSDANHTESLASIPEQTFQAFLKRLEAADLPAAVVERLRNANIEGQALSEAAIRSALFNDGKLRFGTIVCHDVSNQANS